MLQPSHLPALAAGIGLGIAGFAPLLAVIWMVRSRCIKPTVAKGIAALAVSFAFLMMAFAVAWLLVPRHLTVVAIGFLVGFLAMWAVLAAKSVSH